MRSFRITRRNETPRDFDSMEDSHLENCVISKKFEGRDYNIIDRDQNMKRVIKLCSNSGLGLLEVLISLGLLAIVSLGFVSMYVSSLFGQKGVSILSDMNSLVAQMQLTMTSNQACKNALTGQDPKIGNELIFHGASGNEILAQKDKQFSGWQIDSVSFTKVSNITHPLGPEDLDDRFLGELSVKGTRNRSQAIGGEMGARTIPVIFTRTGIGGPINECGVKGFLEIIDGPKVHGNLKINGGISCDGGASRAKCLTLKSRCPPGYRVHQCGHCVDSDPRPALAPVIPCTSPTQTFSYTRFSGIDSTLAVGLDVTREGADTCVLTAYANFPVDTNFADASLDSYNQFENIGILLMAQCINAGY